jgi:hypothetical protein
MKQLLFISMLLPFFSMAQTNKCWSLFLDKQKLVESTIGKTADFSLSNTAKGILKIKYTCKQEADWKTSFIVMNKERQNLFQVDLSKNKTASFSLQTIEHKIGKTYFDIYTVSTPLDSVLAMSVRIKPILLCRIIR